VRAITRPYPGAYANVGGKRLLIWQARKVDSTAHHDGPVLQFPDGRLAATEWEFV
jgi:methionyl-tRNA formyltransferase